jgi:hypothetical protein
MNTYIKQGVARICNILAASLIVLLITLQYAKAVELRADADTNATIEHFSAETDVAARSFISAASPLAPHLEKTDSIAANAHGEYNAVKNDLDTFMLRYDEVAIGHANSLSQSDMEALTNAANEIVRVTQSYIDSHHLQVTNKLKTANINISATLDKMTNIKNNKRNTASKIDLSNHKILTDIKFPPVKDKFEDLYVKSIDELNRKAGVSLSSLFTTMSN